MRTLRIARKGLSLDRLAGFLAVVDGGGVSAGARRDPVRQSQLSRQVRDLEEFFGTPLFDRQRGMCCLTRTGRELAEIARPMLTQFEDLRCMSCNEASEVHVGAGESALVWFLMPRLKALLASRPGVHYTLHNLQSEEIVTRLRDGRLDFGFLRGPGVGPGMTGLSVGEVRYALFVPRVMAPSREHLCDPDALLSLPLAVLEGGGSISEALESWSTENGVSLNVRLRCTSLIQAAAAVEHASMAAVLPVWAARAFRPGAVVQCSLPPLNKLSTPIWLVWSRKQARIRPFLVRCAKAIAAACRGAGRFDPQQTQSAKPTRPGL